jgi:DNA-binding IclR family transcriptional regulator
MYRMAKGGQKRATEIGNAASRLLAVLNLFTVDKYEWTVEDAAREIGVSVSTAYRYFGELCKAGLLDRFSGNKYILGPAVIENDRKIQLADPLIKVGRPAMQRLADRSGSMGVAILCRIYRNCVMCVHQESRAVPENFVGYERGRPMPMFRGASSKVIFANLPSRSARWFFERYPAEICEAGLGSDWETVRTNLRRLRKEGVLVTFGEVDSGRVGIAAPVFGPERNVIGSVGVAIAETEATPQAIANISALVQAASREIDAGLRQLSNDEAPQGSSDSYDRASQPNELSGATNAGNTGASENR